MIHVSWAEGGRGQEKLDGRQERVKLEGKARAKEGRWVVGRRGRDASN